MGSTDYGFPMPGDVRKARKLYRFFQPHGIMVLTGWSLREVTSFYRQELWKQGLKEEKFFETEAENFANLVFSGLPRGRAIIVIVMEAPDQNLRVITIDIKDARRYTTPPGYEKFSGL